MHGQRSKLTDKCHNMHKSTIVSKDYVRMFNVHAGACPDVSFMHACSMGDNGDSHLMFDLEVPRLKKTPLCWSFNNIEDAGNLKLAATTLLD